MFAVHSIVLLIDYLPRFGDLIHLDFIVETSEGASLLHIRDGTNVMNSQERYVTAGTGTLPDIPNTSQKNP